MTNQADHNLKIKVEIILIIGLSSEGIRFYRLSQELGNKGFDYDSKSLKKLVKEMVASRLLRSRFGYYKLGETGEAILNYALANLDEVYERAKNNGFED